MNTRLYIENYEMDIASDLPALLSFAIDDIANFGSRNTSFSKTIIMPGTARNNQRFGHIYDVKSGNLHDAGQANIGYNYNAAKSAKALILQDNIQVFKGVVRLLEVIITNGSIEYEVAVFGELGGFISAMGNSRLEDLDFSDYDHEYNLTAVTDSWDNTPGTGVYYPLIDYGTYSSNKADWDYHTFRPALYVKEYLDKMFEAANYTYDCSLFNTSRFKGLIIPHNQKQLTKMTTQLLDVEGAETIDTGSFTGAFDQDLSFPTQLILGSFTSSLGDTRYTYNSATTVNGDIRFGFVYSLNRSISGSAVIRVYKNGSLLDERYLATGTNINVDFTITNEAINQNDYITVAFQCAAIAISGATTLTISYSHLRVNSTTGATVPSLVNFGDDIQMNDYIPKNILQKDVFTSIIKKFNLMVVEDKFDSRKLTITPYVDFYDTDPGNAIDWSYKMDRSKAIKLKPLSELNARYYEYNFKSDSDYFNETYRKRYNAGYGDYKYDSGYEFSKESEKLEVIFSATPLVGYTGEDKVYSTIMKWDGGSSGTNEQVVDSNIRILQTKKITGVTSWDIKDGGSVLGSYTSYGYAGHYDDPDAPANDIHFGVPAELFFTLLTGAINVNQFNVYWSEYLSEITHKDSKLMTAYFYLNAKDIYDLDFSKPIYVEGSHFTINKVEDWDAITPQLCKVELLKRIYLEY